MHGLDYKCSSILQAKSKNELVCRTIKGLFGVCFESSKPLIKQTFPEKFPLAGKHL